VAKFGEQTDQQAGIEAAGEQHTDRHVGRGVLALDRRQQRRADAHQPGAFAHGLRRPLRPELPVWARRHGALASTVITCAGANLRTPRKSVRGAGTTACKVR